MAGQHTQSLAATTAQVVSAYVANNKVFPADLPALIDQVHQALSRLGNAAEAAPITPPTPAVAIKKSITPEYLVCLEDGLRFKSLKRHLNTRYNLTPEQYRLKWSLPADYPMVAPAYAETRSALAKASGLGRRAGQFARKRSGSNR